MAKNAAEQEQKQAGERPYIAKLEVWENTGTPEFGGQADILQVNVGEVAGPFEYMGHQSMNLSGKDITVHQGLADDGDTYRLPIAASFLRAMDQADLFKGDKFLLRRSEDTKKKAGIGKGTNMQIFAVKVVSRVNRPAPEGKPF